MYGVVFILILQSAIGAQAEDFKAPVEDDEEYKSYWKGFKVDIRPPVDETPFNEIQNRFLQAESPPQSGFNDNAILIGGCTSRLDPQRKIGASASLIINTDSVLGRKIYLRPRYYEDPKSLTHLDQLRRQFEIDSKALNQLTMLRPLEASLYDTQTITALSGSLLFSIQKAMNAITLAPHSNPQFFMARSERPNIVRTLLGTDIGTLWVSQLCADKGGCHCPIGKCFGSAPEAASILICGFDMVNAIAPVEE